jgi:CheY-like chemotaxis protein
MSQDSTEAARPSGARILVAEDEESVRRLIDRVLKACGYSVVCAPDGQEALAEASEIDGLALLITDVVMPGGDGIDLARQLRATQPDLPVLFISGYPQAAIDEGIGGTGQVAFLAKPFKTDALMNHVQRLIDGDEACDLAYG